jgi:hypothetical protein
MLLAGYRFGVAECCAVRSQRSRVASTMPNVGPAAAGTPPDIIERLRSQIVRTVVMPDVRNVFLVENSEPVRNTAAQICGRHQCVGHALGAGCEGGRNPRSIDSRGCVGPP